MASSRLDKTYMDVASFRVQLLLTKMGLNNLTHLDKHKKDQYQVFHVEFDVFQYNLPDQVIKHIINKGIVQGQIFYLTDSFACMRETSSAQPPAGSKSLFLYLQALTNQALVWAIEVVESLVNEAVETEDTQPTFQKPKFDRGTYCESQIEIKDLPDPVVKHVITKGIIEGHIHQSSGAVVSTKGSPFASKQSTNTKKRYIYLSIQAPIQSKVEAAAKMIDRLIQEGKKEFPATSVLQPQLPIGTQQGSILQEARIQSPENVDDFDSLQQALKMAQNLFADTQEQPVISQPQGGPGTEDDALQKALSMTQQLLDEAQPPVPESDNTEVEQALLMAKQLLESSQPQTTPDVPQQPDSMEQALMMAKQLFDNTQQSPVRTDPSHTQQLLTNQLLANQQLGNTQQMGTNLMQLYTQQLLSNMQQTMTQQIQTVFTTKDYGGSLTPGTQSLFAPPPTVPQLGPQVPVPDQSLSEDQDPLALALGKLKEIVGEESSEDQKAEIAPPPSESEDDPQSQLLSNIIQQLQQDVALVEPERSGYRMPEIHLSTWHVSGFTLPTDMERLDAIFYGSSDKKNWEPADRSHVICLQNTGQEMGVVEMNHYTWYCSGFDSDQRQDHGVAVLILKSGPVKMKKFSPVSDFVCVAQLTVEERVLTVVCCYLPLPHHRSYEQVCETISKQVERAPKPVLLMGNFNACVGKSEVSLCQMGEDQVPRLGLARHHNTSNQNGLYLKQLAEMHNLTFNSTVLRDKYRSPVTFIEGTSCAQLSYILMSVDSRLCGYMTKKCWDLGKVMRHARLCIKVTD